MGAHSTVWCPYQPQPADTNQANLEPAELASMTVVSRLSFLWLHRPRGSGDTDAGWLAPNVGTVVTAYTANSGGRSIGSGVAPTPVGCPMLLDGHHYLRGSAAWTGTRSLTCRTR